MSTATGRAGFASTSLLSLNLGQGTISYASRVGFQTLSDATNRYTVENGLFNIVSSTPNYGVFFRYTDSVNGGRWEAVTNNNGVLTVLDTGVSPSTAAFQLLEIDINAAGNSAVFKINGATVATISTNFPGSGISLACGHNVRRSLGTAAVNATVLDYVSIDALFSAR